MRAKILWMVAIAAAFSCAAWAQDGWTYGDVTLGGAWVSPRPDASGVEMDDAAGLAVDYTQYFAKHFAVNFSYTYADLRVKSPSPYWPGSVVQEDLGLSSFTLAFQFHGAAGGKVDPYIGVGFNFLYTPADFYREVYLADGFIVPAGGGSSGYLGAAFQAGVTFNLTNSPLVLRLGAEYADNGLRMDYYRWVYVPGAAYYAYSGDYELTVNPLRVTFSVGARW